MSMATTARSQPGTSEVRIPCPVCAQPVHPVAGRCKHCKTDLVKLRESRGVRAPRLDPASLGAVPVMAPSPFAPAPMAGMAAGVAAAAPRLDAVDATPTPMPVPAAMSLGDGELIEPAPPVRKSRWPLIVMLLAGVAIVVCLALLLGGDEPARAGGSSKRSGAGGGMPAPDRMDTMPAPPVPTPMQPAPDLRNPFDDPAPTPDPTPDPNNPFNNPTPPPSPPRGGAVPTAEEFSEAVIQHGCDRLKSCGMDQTIGMICSAADTLGLADYTKELVRSGRCTYDPAAAGECLAAIDGFQCTGGTLDFDQLSKTFLSIGSCARALSCH